MRAFSLSMPKQENAYWKSVPTGKLVSKRFCKMAAFPIYTYWDIQVKIWNEITLILKSIFSYLLKLLDFLYKIIRIFMAQMAKRLPTMQETWVQSLGREDLLEKEMATHSSILAWKIPWTEEEPGRLQSTGLQRVGHDWATSLHFKKISGMEIHKLV